MPSEGGVPKRISYTDSFRISICAWSEDNSTVYFTSPHQQAFYKHSNIFKISIDGGLPESLELGHAKHISFGSNNRCVIGRNTDGVERWKRYRGGTAGKIWIDNEGKGNFVEWTGVNGNFNCPMWVGERIYFLSDHEGISNIYSIQSDGEDLKKHTNHKNYFAKQANTDGKTIVYAAGGDLYAYSIEEDTSSKIEIEYISPRVQHQRKFVDATGYLQGYAIHPEGHHLVMNTRGKLFDMGNWEGPVIPVHAEGQVRHRNVCYLNSGDGFVYVSDEGGIEHIEIYDKIKQSKRSIDGLDHGRIVKIKVSPDDNYAAIVNHKFELILIDLVKSTMHTIDRAKNLWLDGFNFSPDSKWLTYAVGSSGETCSIKVFNTTDQSVNEISEGDFIDFSPDFSSCGQYIHFLSNRMYNPVYDTVYFDVNFPRTTKACCIPLTKDAMNPFVAVPKTPGEEEDFGPNKEEKKTPEVKIDFDGIVSRIVAMPIKEGNYDKLICADKKVLLLKQPIKGSLDRNIYSNAVKPSGSITCWDFNFQREKTLVDGVSDFSISSKSQTLIYRSANKLRVLSLEADVSSKKGSGNSRKTGWIDLSRVKVPVIPAKEWVQIFGEIWRLQKEQFWVENLSKVDWDVVWNRYRPLADRLGSRAELSDLAWEMQGELGTSHAYEIGGDYRQSRYYGTGFLACDFSYDKKEDAYRIDRILNGDGWNKTYISPLRQPGLNINEGDFIVSINNIPLNASLTPNEVLVNHSGDTLILGIKGQSEKAVRNLHVQTQSAETMVRYRDWVEKKRAYVHEKTNGKIGYVHIPNMAPFGYSEFHRYYLTESKKEGLILDVRYNGGGHVSQLLLEKLNRKQIGYDIARWKEGYDAYPEHAVNGPLVALTNEFAGSDGDIFSHCFKLMKLGPLVGRRTWGGVIGIWPRHFLIDGSVTTQPEFSFWFKDVGFEVENYGTDPDIFVDIAPQDYKAGKDPQLDRSIEEVLKLHQENPPYVPDFGDFPDLSLPS